MMRVGNKAVCRWIMCCSLKEATIAEMRDEGDHGVLEKDNDNLPSVAQVKASIATALGAAAANAKLLADQEEREMEQCMSDIIENQVGAIFYLLYMN
jgi:hypothetical protein